MASETAHSRLRFVTAGILFAIVAILVVIIVPPIATDTFRGARPRAATTAFVVTAILHALLAMFVVRSSRSAGRISAWAGVFALILGLILLDAAFAFRAHGSALRVANAGMFVCVFSDFVAAMLIFSVALFRSRASGKPIRLFE